MKKLCYFIIILIFGAASLEKYTLGLLEVPVYDEEHALLRLSFVMEYQYDPELLEGTTIRPVWKVQSVPILPDSVVVA